MKTRECDNPGDEKHRQEIGTKNDEVLMARSGGQALAPSHNSDPTTVTQSMMTKVAHAVRSQKSRRQGGGGRVDEVGGDVAQQKKLSLVQSDGECVMWGIRCIRLVLDVEYA